MDPSSIPVVDLLPHGPEMTIIDRLVAFDGKRSVAVVRVTPKAKFFSASGVPAWVGIEYMAQTIAAHAGFEARLRGDPPPIGFLLGTRAYECTVPEFPAGARLEVVVEQLLAESGFGSFDCTIEADRLLAKGVLNTYRPSDADIAKIREGLGGG
jgi:predicted hotdog family 3-hydroxylacyl-ACP dehydratase